MYYSEENSNALLQFWVMFAVWFIASMLLANWAQKTKKKIGFWPAFFISLFLSPFVGVICITISPEKEPEVLAE